MAIQLPRLPQAVKDTKAELVEINNVLNAINQAYQQELINISRISFKSRLVTFLKKVMTLGGYDHNAWQKEQEHKIHQKFSPQIAKAEEVKSQVSSTLEFLIELADAYSIALAPGARPDGYPANWSEIAGEVRERDQYRCNECGATGRKLHVHHMTHLLDGGSNSTTNLITLCEPCHISKHPHMRR